MRAVTLATFSLLCFSSLHATSMSVPSKIEGEHLLTRQKLNVGLRREDRSLVVVFLSARCPCSSSHEASLKELHREFSKQGFIFVGVHSNADEDIKMASEHFSGSQLPFPIVDDGKSVIADRFGALKTPHVFVVSGGGELLYQGGVDDSHRADKASRFFLKEALTAVAKGDVPEVKSSRTLGCYISRP